MGPYGHGTPSVQQVGILCQSFLFYGSKCWPVKTDFCFGFLDQNGSGAQRDGFSLVIRACVTAPSLPAPSLGASCTAPAGSQPQDMTVNKHVEVCPSSSLKSLNIRMFVLFCVGKFHVIHTDCLRLTVHASIGCVHWDVCFCVGRPAHGTLMRG